MSAEFPVVFALYPDITQLDFTGPLEVLCRVPGAVVTIASVGGGGLRASGGVRFAGVWRLRRCASARCCASPADLAPARPCSMRLSTQPAPLGRERPLPDLGLHRLAAARGRRTLARAPRRLSLGLSRAAAALRRDSGDGARRARWQHLQRRRRDRRHRHGAHGGGGDRRPRIRRGRAAGDRVRARAALCRRPPGAAPPPLVQVRQRFDAVWPERNAAAERRRGLARASSAETRRAARRRLLRSHPGSGSPALAVTILLLQYRPVLQDSARGRALEARRRHTASRE